MHGYSHPRPRCPGASGCQWRLKGKPTPRGHRPRRGRAAVSAATFLFSRLPFPAAAAEGAAGTYMFVNACSLPGIKHPARDDGRKNRPGAPEAPAATTPGPVFTTRSHCSGCHSAPQRSGLPPGSREAPPGGPAGGWAWWAPAAPGMSLSSQHPAEPPPIGVRGRFWKSPWHMARTIVTSSSMLP